MPLKLVILGASGGCGRHLVQQAAAAGHRVVAVGRATSSLDDVPDGVTVARGDVDDVDFLATTFEGADVVLSGLGIRMSGIAPWATAEDITLMSRAGPAIAEAVDQAGVPRVLAITAGGVGSSWDIMPFFFKALIKMSALRVAYNDLEGFEAGFAGCSAQVMFARPTGLTDEAATGKTVVATRLVGNSQIPRADVAAWVLEHLEGELPELGPVITVTGAG